MARPSELARNWFRVRHQQVTFKGFEWMPGALDSGFKNVLFYTSRQVGKSTAISMRGIIKCAAIPYYTRMYVAPTQNHCGAYSKQKLSDLILSSPIFVKKYFGKGRTNQAYFKGFTNGSGYWLRWFATGVNSVRGLSVDGVDIDEVQLIQSDDIPVVRENMRRSPYKDLTYAGTPLHNQNPIEDLWKRSTRDEWMVKCYHCNRHNYLDERNISKFFLQCRYCSTADSPKQIFPQQGLWVRTTREPSTYLRGVRVNALMVSEIPWTPELGGEDSIVWMYENYPSNQFRNEVLALPGGDADRPITEEELINCCDPELKMCTSIADKPYLARMNLFGGADWATDAESRKSYNVHVVGGFLPNEDFLFVYARRFKGRESDKTYLLNNIVQIQKSFRSPFVGADWGMGADRCYDLANMLKPMHGGVTAFMYNAVQKPLLMLHPTGRMFQVNRSLAHSMFFNLLRRQKILFFNYGQAKEFLQDILNVYSYFNKDIRMVVYNHDDKNPDDVLQACIFSYLAAAMNRKFKHLGRPH